VERDSLKQFLEWTCLIKVDKTCFGNFPNILTISERLDLSPKLFRSVASMQEFLYLACRRILELYCVSIVFNAMSRNQFFCPIKEKIARCVQVTDFGIHADGK
jgi:hypothetical protein